MSFEVQQRIKNNAKEVKDYLNDLHQWEQHMDTRQYKTHTTHNPTHATTEAELDSPKGAPGTNEEFKTLKRDINTVGDYYNAWNKFDVDQELNTLDNQPSRVYNPYDNSKSNIRAKPKMEMAVKGGRAAPKDPTSLKDRGNMHFNSCEFDKAIDCYSECLNKLQGESNRQLRAIVYSNRAMARLKRNHLQEAVDDTTASIDLNPNYTKSYMRRATALKRLKRFKLSKRDFQKVLEQQPNNQQAQSELSRVNKVVLNLVQEAHDRLVIPMNFSSIPTERIAIEEVEQQEQQEPQGKVHNYLDDL